MSDYSLSGGDKIQAALEEIARKMGGGSVSVGFLEGATYKDGTPVAAVAFWNEYGIPSRGQPPRPFFRRMIADESPTWPEKMAALAKVKDYNGQEVLTIMGDDIKGALQYSINNFYDPPLAQSTIDRKGFDKPLIGGGLETGHMLNSVGFEVNE